MLRTACVLGAIVLAAACGSPSSGGSDAPGARDGSGSGGGGDGSGSGSSVDDGTPTRRQCTSQFGNALTTSFGRMDGILVSVIPPSGGPCNADEDHVHLQVEIAGETYDVAVDVASSSGPDDVHTMTRDATLPGAAWSEGWHPGIALDYTQLGIHSADLTLETKAQLTADLMADLQTVNHISVFGTGYGPDGAHLVHREGSLHDGMIVMQPLSATTHQRLFSFSDQSF